MSPGPDSCGSRGGGGGGVGGDWAKINGKCSFPIKKLLAATE